LHSPLRRLCAASIAKYLQAIHHIIYPTLYIPSLTTHIPPDITLTTRGPYAACAITYNNFSLLTISFTSLFRSHPQQLVSSPEQDLPFRGLCTAFAVKYLQAIHHIHVSTSIVRIPNSTIRIQPSITIFTIQESVRSLQSQVSPGYLLYSLPHLLHLIFSNPYSVHHQIYHSGVRGQSSSQLRGSCAAFVVEYFRALHHIHISSFNKSYPAEHQIYHSGSLHSLRLNSGVRAQPSQLNIFRLSTISTSQPQKYTPSPASLIYHSGVRAQPSSQLRGLYVILNSGIRVQPS
jgi:hypothetical protein